MKPAPAVVMVTAWPVIPATVVGCGWLFSAGLSLHGLQGAALLWSAMLHGVCLMLMAQLAARHVPGWLMWTGESWRIHAGAPRDPDRPRVSHEVVLCQALDLQCAMVVSTSGPGGRHWWWVSSGRHPGHWASWRRAVMAHGIERGRPVRADGS